MGMTEYGESLLLNCMLNIVNPPATLYLALTGREPAVYGTGDSLNEPLDSAYARQEVGTGGSNWTAAESGISTYNAAVQFPVATENWLVIEYWALTTAATSGTVIIWGQFDTPSSVLTGQRLTIPANSFGLSVGSPDPNLVL